MSGAPIGILGGTFDPVHCGHLRLAVEVREALGFDHVRLIPAAVPNHRPQPAASGALRVEMLRAGAVAPGLVVDTRELDRGGVSYMFDTLASLRAELGSRALCLVLGMDAFNGLPGWHRWQELGALAHFVVATRPDSEPRWSPELDAFVAAARVEDPAALAATPAGRIHFQRIPLLPISSSDIRRRLQAGLSIDYLVPAPVLAIIERERLYRSS
jgi:nicotinate-nucleotide adenylyltransferase